MSSFFHKRHDQSHFYDFEDSDEESSRPSSKFKTYVPPSQHHPHNLDDILVESTTRDPKPGKHIIHALPSSSNGFDDLVDLLHVSPTSQTNASHNERSYSAAFYAVRTTFCHKLLIFAKKLGIFIRGNLTRRKRRYSFDLASTDFGFELASANNKRKNSNLTLQLSSAKTIITDGIRSAFFLVMLIGTLCFLWLQILKPGTRQINSSNPFRNEGIKRVVLPMGFIQHIETDHADGLLGSQKAVSSYVSNAPPTVVLLHEHQTGAIQGKKSQHKEGLTGDILVPVDTLPSLTKAEFKEEIKILLPSSFKNLANFPSTRRPGDIPVVSFDL